MSVHSGFNQGSDIPEKWMLTSRGIFSSKRAKLATSSSRFALPRRYWRSNLLCGQNRQLIRHPIVVVISNVPRGSIYACLSSLRFEVNSAGIRRYAEATQPLDKVVVVKCSWIEG